jgi:hypothetical protein
MIYYCAWKNQKLGLYWSGEAKVFVNIIFFWIYYDEKNLLILFADVS